jgi:hypothetical protein
LLLKDWIKAVRLAGDKRLIAVRRSFRPSNGSSSEAGFVRVVSMSPCCAAFFIFGAEIRFRSLRFEQSSNYQCRFILIACLPMASAAR